MLVSKVLPSLMRSGLAGLHVTQFASRNVVAASVSSRPAFNAAWPSSASSTALISPSGSTARSFSNSAPGNRGLIGEISRQSPPTGTPSPSMLLSLLRAAERSLKIEPVSVRALSVRRLSLTARVPVDESSSSSRDAPNGDKGDARSDDPVPRSVGYWLLAIGGMVYCMVSLGGITRLTESGLSMVDWKLLGRKLPSSDEEWNAEFDKYKQFPEYQLKHYNISLQEYKFIYFMEWFHRMWGRAIGVAFAVPFVVFGARGMLSRSMVKKLGIAMGMGGCQGLVGWYMVKSGLEKPKEEGHEVNVSPYRLCMHLTSAFVIYSYVMWLAMSVLRPRPSALASPSVRGIKKLAHASAGLLGVTIVSGAFVAGNRAGVCFPEWPLMGDSFMPPHMWDIEPIWRNIFENKATVHFDHRCLAYATYGLGMATVIRGLSSVAHLPAASRPALYLVLGFLNLQVLLGIYTVQSHVAVPVAATHQAGSMALLTCLLYLMHTLRLVR